MTFRCGGCGAEVTGRLVLVCQVLQVRSFVERCPGCGRDEEFQPTQMASVQKAAA